MKKQGGDGVDIMLSEDASFSKTFHLSKDDVQRRYLYRFFKRVIDILVGLVGLVILLPLFLIIALAIKKEDKDGAIFFSQPRAGRNGKIFNMYKFRSMYSDAEERLEELLKYNEVSGAMFKMENDPRVTNVGAFLRKYSLDELPQLINVLKGEMSLVGPRPPLIREVAEYTNFDKQRLMVTPGMTGLWQVSGRSSLSFSQMVALDIEYILKQSFSFDLKILLKTFLVVIKSDNAY